jgi:hypothetical protein
MYSAFLMSMSLFSFAKKDKNTIKVLLQVPFTLFLDAMKTYRVSRCVFYNALSSSTPVKDKIEKI